MANQSYQWDAQEYARHSAAQFGWAQELIGKLHLRGDEQVLDIGCGDGKVTAMMAGMVAKGGVTGVDRSWAMVALAHQQFCCGGKALRNLAFAQMDAAGLAFASGFDVAFSNAALHWVKDHRSVLAGVARSLKPAGRVLFQMGGRGNAADIVAVMDEMRERSEWRGYFHDFRFPYGFYGPEEYGPLLEETGLKARRVELIARDMQHAGREGLAGWIRTTWLPYTERVPQERREAFIAQVADNYLQNRPIDGQGIAHVQMMRLEVEAVNE
jgi:trans-aconitate methyltransferase